MVQVLREGYRNSALSIQDLGQVTSTSAEVYARFDKTWQRNAHKSMALTRSLLEAFTPEILGPAVVAVLYALFLIVVPLELDALLSFLRRVAPNYAHDKTLTCFSAPGVMATPRNLSLMVGP